MQTLKTCIKRCCLLTPLIVCVCVFFSCSIVILLMCLLMVLFLFLVFAFVALLPSHFVYSCILLALAPCLAYYHTLPIFMPCCFHTLFVHALLTHALLSHLTALCLVLVPRFHALLSYSHTLLCYSCTLLLIVLVFVPCFYL